MLPYQQAVPSHVIFDIQIEIASFNLHIAVICMALHRYGVQWYTSAPCPDYWLLGHGVSLC